jgi:hypothetical protein
VIHVTVDHQVESQASGEQASAESELFRSVNLKILGLRMPWENEYELVCECGSSLCFEVLRIDPVAYEAVCSEPLAFVVRPGHDDPNADEIVSTTPRYSVIRHAAGRSAR